MRLVDCRVLITGGGSGIGPALGHSRVASPPANLERYADEVLSIIASERHEPDRRSCRFATLHRERRRTRGYAARASSDRMRRWKKRSVSGAVSSFDP